MPLTPKLENTFTDRTLELSHIMKYIEFVGSNGLASSDYNWTQISLHEMS